MNRTVITTVGVVLGVGAVVGVWWVLSKPSVFPPVDFKAPRVPGGWDKVDDE